MALGVRTSRYRRLPHGQATAIDGLPVILKAGNISYVDGALSSTGTGISFTDAFNTVQRAVTAAGKNDTIFIKPLNAGVRYTENVSFSVASNADHTKEGISIISTGNGRISGTRDQAAIMQGVTGVNQPVILADASYTNFENLSFLSKPAQVGLTHPFAILMRQNSAGGVAGSTGFNVGSSIVNCGFLGDFENHPPVADIQSAVHLIATDGHVLEGNVFTDCSIGVSSSGDLTGNSCILIKDNIFAGTAANISADLYLIDVNKLNIVNNTFGHALPSNNNGNLKKYILCSGTTLGVIDRNSFATDTATEATNITVNGMMMGVNYVAGAFLAA